VALGLRQWMEPQERPVREVQRFQLQARLTTVLQ